MQSPFDFTNGDAITVEAWVQVGSLKGGENVYVIGKGRTGLSGFAADNQNWALRVRETKGKGGISFLFATVPGSDREIQTSTGIAGLRKADLIPASTGITLPSLTSLANPKAFAAGSMGSRNLVSGTWAVPRPKLLSLTMTLSGLVPLRGGAAGRVFTVHSTPSPSIVKLLTTK